MCSRFPLPPRVSVTNENRVDFVRRYVKWFLSGKVARQYDAFERGFRMLCGLSKEEDAMNLFRSVLAEGKRYRSWQ